MAIIFKEISYLKQLTNPNTSIIIADSNTIKYAPAEFTKQLLVPCGEEAKQLGALDYVLSQFLELKVDRTSTIIGMGGGCVLDLAGFAASIWMRGIDFGFVPTSLLAMVDAAIGGKNGINYKGYKNMIGAISNPRFVLIDKSTLASLPYNELTFGFSEIVKHAIIDNHLDLIENYIFKNGNINTNNLLSLIKKSISIKKNIVKLDPKDFSSRMVLNFGHTLAHAIESIIHIPHGEAVSVGMVFAIRFSQYLIGYTSELDMLEKKVVNILTKLKLPTNISTVCKDRDSICSALEADKKRASSKINFVLVKSAGNVYIDNIDISIIKSFLREAP